MCAAALTLGYCSGPLGDWRSRHVSEPLFRPLSAEARPEYVNLFRKVWQRRGYNISAEMWQTAGFDASWTVDYVDCIFGAIGAKRRAEWFGLVSSAFRSP